MNDPDVAGGIVTVLEQHDNRLITLEQDRELLKFDAKYLAEDSSRAHSFTLPLIIMVVSAMVPDVGWVGVAVGGIWLGIGLRGAFQARGDYFRERRHIVSMHEAARARALRMHRD